MYTSKSVLPLTKLALNTILRNTHMLTDLGHLEELYKEQILSKCNPQKLGELQKVAFRDQPYYSDHDRKLYENCWKVHCLKRFNQTKLLAASWRETYSKLVQEDEKKKNQQREILRKHAEAEKLQREQTKTKVTERTQLSRPVRAPQARAGINKPRPHAPAPPQNPLVKKLLNSAKKRKKDVGRIQTKA